MADFLQTILSVSAAHHVHVPEDRSGTDTTTLYRAEAAPTGHRPPEWIKEVQDSSGHTEAAGRWFTMDPEGLGWYREDAGPRARVFCVEVPTADLDAFRVSNCTEVIAGRRVSSFSRDPANEFFLPKSLAASRKGVSPGMETKPRDGVVIAPDATPAPRVNLDGAFASP